MNVLVSLTDPRFGGPQRSTLEVAEILANQGIETQFLLPDGAGRFLNIARNRGFTVHRPGLGRLFPPRQVVKNARYGVQSPIDVMKIIKIIKENNIDVVNARTTISFRAAAAAILSDTPLVWHFNDVTKPKPIASISSAVASRCADEIIVSAENVIDYYFEDCNNTTKIHPSVDPSQFKPERDSGGLSDEINITPNTPIIGLVGNINPIKGYDIFLSAFKQVVERHPEVVVAIAGRKLATQETYYQNLRSQVKEDGLDDRVHFLGWIENIKEFLSDIDLFVMPSRSETGPMTLMEAMAMEKPIVTTNVGVVPEHLADGKHAWIVNSENSEQLAIAIIYALNHRKQWSDFGKNARNRAKEVFSFKSSADKYFNVYMDINNNNN